MDKKTRNLILATVILAVLSVVLLIILIVILAVYVGKANNTNTIVLNITNSEIYYDNNCISGKWGKYCDECGLTFKESNLKVVGGVEAIPASWPSLGLLVFRYKAIIFIPDENVSVTETFSKICGGSLIERSTFLTAAHCFSNKVELKYNEKNYTINVTTNQFYSSYESMYSIYLGLHNQSVIDEENLDSNISPAKRYGVSKIILHEDYDEDNILNDIALFMLSQVATLNNYVQIACLPQNKNNSYPYANTKTFVAGWGNINETGEGTDVLQNAVINVFNDSTCSSYYNQTDFNSQICAGDLDRGIDTCQGDSGGPLYVKETINGKIKYVVSGVVSYGIACGGTPGIYARVTHYLDWIYKNMWFSV